MGYGKLQHTPLNLMSILEGGHSNECYALKRKWKRVDTRFPKLALEDLKVSVGCSKPPKLDFMGKFTPFLKN